MALNARSQDRYSVAEEVIFTGNLNVTSDLILISGHLISILCSFQIAQTTDTISKSHGMAEMIEMSLVHYPDASIRSTIIFVSLRDYKHFGDVIGHVGRDPILLVSAETAAIRQKLRFNAKFAKIVKITAVLFAATDEYRVVPRTSRRLSDEDRLEDGLPPRNTYETADIASVFSLLINMELPDTMYNEAIDPCAEEWIFDCVFPRYSLIWFPNRASPPSSIKLPPMLPVELGEGIYKPRGLTKCMKNLSEKIYNFRLLEDGTPKVGIDSSSNLITPPGMRLELDYLYFNDAEYVLSTDNKVAEDETPETLYYDKQIANNFNPESSTRNKIGYEDIIKDTSDNVIQIAILTLYPRLGRTLQNAVGLLIDYEARSMPTQMALSNLHAKRLELIWIVTANES
ncbi:2652_t:CDS:10 [Paraglomus occultum]|uniref:2652_t:CDS:1 n=1 Tax=Paraglomus occultum TaxID=144539 RepID=A0A9N9C6R4_9GLOM|nr:2652_t:CDS:10 [Paraglomus occultum]